MRGGQGTCKRDGERMGKGAGCYRRYIGEGEAGGGERREIRSDEKN